MKSSHYLKDKFIKTIEVVEPFKIIVVYGATGTFPFIIFILGKISSIYLSELIFLAFFPLFLSL